MAQVMTELNSLRQQRQDTRGRSPTEKPIVEEGAAEPRYTEQEWYAWQNSGGDDGPDHQQANEGEATMPPPTVGAR